MDSSSFLLTHFDRLAEAPGGIAKLRALLLQLSVQGKLTQQSPEDTSATEIISHFRKPKQPFAPISADELPFQIPATWVWARLGACMELFNGRAFKPTDWSTQGLPIIRIKNLNNESAPFNHCATAVDDRHLVTNDDFLISWSGTPGTSFGAFIWKRGKAVLNQHIFRAELSSPELYKPYLRLAVNSRLDELIEKAHGGVGLQHVTKPTLERLPLPIPPLAEQRRIVAKVEELMGLCDALEAAQREREAVRTHLRTSALHQLASPDSDSKSVAFVLEHLPLLTTESDDLASIRQAVLQFAVSGKLSADVTSKEQTNKSANSLSSIEDGDNASADILPSSWHWAYLKEACDLITDGTHLTPRYTTSGRMFLSAQNVKPFRFMPAKHRFVSEEDYQGYVKNRKPTLGDVLLTRVGAGIGEAAVINQEIDFAIYVSLGLIRPTSALLIPEFLAIWLNSPAGRSYSSTNTLGKGASQGNLNLGLIRKFVIPLPPLAEQRRIVAKVDELMAVLAALEATLTTARTTAEALLAATIAKLHAA